MRRGTRALLLGAVTVAYVGWIWPSPTVDYSGGQVGGFLLTVLALTALAVRAGLRPRPVVNAVLATLLAVAFVDVVAVDGDDLWLFAAFFYGPFVWVCCYVPALLLESVLWPTPLPPEEQPPAVPDPDAQVAAWRRYRDRTIGG